MKNRLVFALVMAIIIFLVIMAIASQTGGIISNLEGTQTQRAYDRELAGTLEAEYK